MHARCSNRRARCSRACTVAASARVCRMDSPAVAPRRSTRASQQPLSLAEEQAASPCSPMRSCVTCSLLRRSSSSRPNLPFWTGGISGVARSFRHLQFKEQQTVRRAVSMLVSTQATQHAGGSGPAAAPLLSAHASSVLTPWALWPSNSPLFCSNSDCCSHALLRASSQPAPPCSMLLPSRARLCTGHRRLMTTPLRAYRASSFPSGPAALLQRCTLFIPPPLCCSDEALPRSRWLWRHARHGLR